MADDPLITINDIRQAHYCTGGARAWFKLHDLDWPAFIADGLPASTLLATGDGMAERVVQVKKERSGG